MPVDFDGIEVSEQGIRVQMPIFSSSKFFVRLFGWGFFVFAVFPL